MAKVVKNETRDEVYEILAKLLVDDYFHQEGKIMRYKEGLRFDYGEETHIIRVIKKKSEPEKNDIIGQYGENEKGQFHYMDLKEEKKNK